MKIVARSFGLVASILLVPIAASAATVATGSNHTVVRASDGTVWTWGNNANGQLGLGDTTQRKVPTKITSLTGITQVAAGLNHSVALKSSDGSLWAWGLNNLGQLGDGTTTQRKTPVAVLTAAGAALNGVAAVACGDSFCLAVKTTGTVWGWGYNGFGQLGDGTTTNPTSKKAVQTLTLANVGTVAAGSNHSLAVKSDGTVVWSWGQNQIGQLGRTASGSPTLTPTAIPGLTGVSAVAASNNSSRALMTGGTVQAWGDNANGQLGDGTTIAHSSPAPVTGMASVSALGAGLLHTLATRSDDTTIWAWGQGSSGQLGDGLATQSGLPVQVTGLTTMGAAAAGHGTHSIAVTTDGVVWAWGANALGQVGDGTTTQRNSPVALSGPNYNWLVATPTMSVAAGTYNANQSVTLTTVTASASIFYTTNGSTPTAGSTPYTVPVSVQQSMTLKAIAAKTGMPSSNIGSATYVLTPTMPTFTPGQGLYTQAKTVSISATPTGSTIRYTLDGSDPTDFSTVYSAPLTFSTFTTLKAKAFRPNWAPSATGTAVYTFNYGTLAPPIPSPGQGNYAPSVTVYVFPGTGWPAGTSIRYTTDGTPPTPSSPDYYYPFTFTTTTTLKVQAYRLDYTSSTIATAVYTIPTAATPTFSPDGGSHAPGQLITLSTTTTGATIRYTLTGADPTESDPGVPSGGRIFAGNYTLKASAFQTGYLPSPVKSAVYTTTSNLHSGRVIAGLRHTVLAKPDGTVWSWGNNSGGQLGYPVTNGYRGIPWSFGLTGVKAGAAGFEHTLVLRTDGTVWAWGGNGAGQLGDGSLIGRPTPFQVTLPTVVGATTYIAVAAGETHSLAVRSDGKVFAWGNNSNGQLGDGTLTLRKNAVQVATLTNAVAVSAGRYHSHALTANGTVYSWGYGFNGQMGNGTVPTEQTTPVLVDGLTGITAIASSQGAEHTLALRDDGTVWGWGVGSPGQIGDGSILDHLVPSRAALPTIATAIAAGDQYSLALAPDGRIWAWGANGAGQLGNGTTIDSPFAIQLASPTNVVSLGASGSHTHAITSDGSVWSWGYGGMATIGDGRVIYGNPTPIRVSEPGFDWKVGTPMFNPPSGTYGSPTQPVLTVENSGATIHYTTNGSEPTEADAEVPVPTLTATTTVKARAWKSGIPAMPASNTASETYTLKVNAPSANPGGWYYSAPLSVTLTTTSPGAAIYYTVDGSDPTTASLPYTGAITINQTTTLQARAFRAGWTTSDLLYETYTLTLGTLAAPTFTPVAGTYVGSVDVSLSAQAGATIRYTTDGSDPTTSSPAYAAPIPIGENTTVRAIAYHPSYTTSPSASASYVIKLPTPSISPVAGTYAAGQPVTITTAVVGGTIRYTVSGADPTASDTAIGSGVPLRLVASTTIKARVFKIGSEMSDVASAAYTITGGTWNGALSGGGSHSMAIAGNGSLWAWGNNNNGQLGDDTQTERRQPTLILSDVTTEIAAGRYHALRLKNDGTLFGWGANDVGQVGDGTTVANRLAPVPIPSPAGVTAIGVGDDHSLAVAGGVVYAWGRNTNGQVGDGTTIDRRSPTAIAVPGPSPVIAVTGGASHSLALRADGTVWAWGENTFGQLGDGTYTQRTTPVQVSNLAGVTAIASGFSHNLALTGNGTIWAWGRNDAGGGPLGNGTTTTSNLPVQVLYLTTVRAIAADGYFSLAATADGSVWAWGSNSAGQLGDSGANRSTPTPIAGLAGITAIAAGSGTSLALDIEGGIWAWGANFYGQVGDGTNTWRYAPVRITDPAFAWKAGTPMFSNGGTFYTPQTVTLSTATAGAEIHYTNNGGDPTTGDPFVMTGGIVGVDQSMIVKARTFASGLAPSNVDSVSFVLIVPPPTGTPPAGNYPSPQTVTLSSAVGDTTIRYTTNFTEPTETSPAYTIPLPVDRTTTYWARGFRAGWTPSAFASLTYEMRAAPPTLSPGGGVYGEPQTVTLTTATPGAEIHYTTDGSEPTESGPAVVSGGTVLVDRSLTLKAKTWRGSGWTVSTVTIATYSVAQGSAGTPTIVPGTGTYASAQTVTIASGLAGAVIRYTLDGSDPTLSSPIYAAPLTIDATTVLTARAFKAEWTPSPPATATLTITSSAVAPPSFSTPGGPYATQQTVFMTTTTSGADVHYTTNGAVPVVGDPIAPGIGLVVNQHTRLRAKAFKTGMTTSPLRQADYQITGAAASGTNFVVALKTNRTVWSWGSNAVGQMGVGSTIPSSAVPLQVTALSDVIAVSAGSHFSPHAAAVKGDGTVWTWGHNSDGQLGDNSQVQSSVPVQVKRMQDGLPVAVTGVVAVAAGSTHTIALKSDGTLLAWGYNLYGQLGNGNTTTPQLTAVPVLNLTNVVAIAAGDWFSMALRRDGTVWAWGLNDRGELGNGTFAPTSVPTMVPSLSGVASIAAGGFRSFAVKTDGAIAGSVWAWGDNGLYGGYLGDGSEINRSTPVRVLDNGIAAATGGIRTIFLKTASNGQRSLWGTGQHFASIFFPGAPDTSNTPLLVVPGDFVSVSANAKVVALRRDTSLLVWGDNRDSDGTVLGIAGAQAAANADSDQDGLTTAEEAAIGSDPWNPDTNGDGLSDGVAVRSGLSATNPDMDNDGSPNAIELARGTDPFVADTDGDGALDGADAFPLDPTRWQAPPPVPGDVTPPDINLTEPTNAQLMSSVP